MEPFKDVLADSAAWAKKCVEQYGAEMIVVQTKSADPKRATAAFPGTRTESSRGSALSQERSQSSCSLKLWSTGSPERLGARASEVQERRHGNGHAVAGRENTLES
jgi:hypothetical protein